MKFIFCSGHFHANGDDDLNSECFEDSYTTLNYYGNVNCIFL